MNIRQIKLALSVGLMNAPSDNNLLTLVKELMLGFKEVGAFLGLKRVKGADLNRSHVREIYALQFEHCELDLELVSNRQTNSHYVQGFQIR